MSYLEVDNIIEEIEKGFDVESLRVEEEQVWPIILNTLVYSIHKGVDAGSTPVKKSPRSKFKAFIRSTLLNLYIAILKFQRKEILNLIVFNSSEKNEEKPKYLDNLF